MVTERSFGAYQGPASRIRFCVCNQAGRATNVGVQATMAVGVSNGAGSSRDRSWCAVGGWIALILIEMQYLARPCRWG